MILGILFIILLLIVIYNLSKREFMSPILIFSSVWLVVIGLYSLKLYNIYDIQTNTQIILFIGIIFYLCGAYFCQYIKIAIPKSMISNKLKMRKINILYFVILISSLYFYIPNILMVFRGITINEIKMMLVTGDIDLGGAWMQYIVRPFLYIIIATATYFLFYKIKNIFLLFIGVIFVLLEFVGTGSKTIILYFIICLLLPLFNKKMSKKIVKSKKTIYFSIALLMIFLFLFMGSSSVYFYICGCVPMLDKVINTSFYMEDGFAFGFVSFNSLIRLIIKVVDLIFGVSIDTEMFDLANKYISRFEYTTQISSLGNYNAFHTFIGDFYVDLGWFGVILFSFLFGLVSMYIYKLYVKTDSLHAHIMYCLIMYYIVFGIVRFQMSNTFFGLMLIYSILFLKYFIYDSGFRINKIRI